MAEVPKQLNFFEKLREGVTNLDIQVNDLKSLVEANKREASSRGVDCLRQFQCKIQDKHSEIVQLKSDVSNSLNFDDIEHSIVALEKKMNDFISGDHQHDKSSFIKYGFSGTPPPVKVIEREAKKVIERNFKDNNFSDVADVTVEFTPGLTTKRPDSTKKASKTREKIKPVKIFEADDSVVNEKEDICQPIIPLTPKTRSMSSRKNPPRTSTMEKSKSIDHRLVSKALDQIQVSLGQSTPTQPIPTKDLIKTAKLVRSLKKIDVGTPQLPSSSIVSAFPFNDKTRILRPRK